MPDLPNTQQQARDDKARTPLLAALGAGDLAAKAVVEALNAAKNKAESTKEALNGIPPTVREKLDPTELRKLVDAYKQSALDLYEFLSKQGEDAWVRLQPRVQKTLGYVDEAVETARKRANEAAGDARSLADDVRNRISAASSQKTTSAVVPPPAASHDVTAEEPSKTTSAANAPNLDS